MMQTIREIISRPLFRQTAQLIWFLMIVFGVSYYFWHNWEAISQYKWQFINLNWVLIAIIWGMIRRLIGGIRWIQILLINNREKRIWRKILDYLDVYFQSNLGRYIPGSLWYMPSRISLSLSKGVNPLRTSLGLVYETGLNIWTGFFVGAYVILTALPFDNSIVTVLAIPLIISPLLMLHPKTYKFLLDWVLRILKKPQTEITISSGWWITSWLLSIGMWIAGGLSQYYCLKALNPVIPFVHMLKITSIVAFSWTIGFLTPWAPSGIGVRDGLLIWLLQDIVPIPLATISAVASRLITVIEDVGWALISLLLQSRKDHNKIIYE